MKAADLNLEIVAHVASLIRAKRDGYIGEDTFNESLADIKRTHRIRLSTLALYERIARAAVGS